MAKIPQRSSVNIFKQEDVSFFYENILLVCESEDVKSYGDIKSLRMISKDMKINEPFGFEYDNYEKKMQNPQDNVFYYSAKVDKSVHNSITTKNTKVVKKFIKHLRNAFVHNYIRIENNAYIFEDYYQENANKPMKKVLYARVLSLDDFKVLISKTKLNFKK